MLRIIARIILAAVLLPGSMHAQAPQATVTSQVVLRPGDQIRVAIWREPELSRDFNVDEHGVVVLPLLGERKVTDVPFPQIREQLVAEYRKELRNPAIEMTPLRRIYVIGEVKKPGHYAVDPTVSLAGVIALAEGPTPEGNVDRLRVVRGGAVLLQGVRSDNILADADIRSGDQIYVPPLNWLARNPTFLPNVITSLLTSIIVTIVASR